MIDQSIDALLEAQLLQLTALRAITTHVISPGIPLDWQSIEKQTGKMLTRLESLIKLRGGRPDEQPAK